MIADFYAHVGNLKMQKYIECQIYRISKIEYFL